MSRVIIDNIASTSVDRPIVDEIGDEPDCEALRELHCFAQAAAQGTSAVLTHDGSREMQKLADELEQRLEAARAAQDARLAAILRSQR